MHKVGKHSVEGDSVQTAREWELRAGGKQVKANRRYAAKLALFLLLIVSALGLVPLSVLADMTVLKHERLKSSKRSD